MITRKVSNPILDNYFNPRNCGILEQANVIGEYGLADKGIIIKFFMLIEDEIIKDIKFKTFGCITSIASASILTEMVKGKKIKDVLNLKPEDISEALGTVPSEKFYCCEYAVMALGNGLEKNKS